MENIRLFNITPFLYQLPCPTLTIPINDVILVHL
jgi:hypothetical protein